MMCVCVLLGCHKFPGILLKIFKINILLRSFDQEAVQDPQSMQLIIQKKIAVRIFFQNNRIGRERLK